MLSNSAFSLRYADFSHWYLVFRIILSRNVVFNQHTIIWWSLSLTFGRSVFFPVTRVSSINKADRQDMTEISLEVVLNTISLIPLNLRTGGWTLSCSTFCSSHSSLKTLHSSSLLYGDSFLVTTVIGRFWWKYCWKWH
jgi:hypothetical protein